MKKLYEEAAVQDIADAIREKTGGAETYRIAQMGAAVRSIPESTTAMTFQVTEAASNVPASAAYFRVSAMGKGENLIITLDEPIE